MPRKDSVPNPPRRVQAPKRRATPAGPADPARKRKLLLGAAAAVLVVVAIVLAVLLFGGSDKSEAAVLQEEGCTLETFPGQEATHLDDRATSAKPNWNSSPPTSGPHLPTPAVYGFYTEEVSLLQTVHNLEHGAIVIHLGSDVPEATIEEIRSFYMEDPNGILVARYPELGDKVSLSAWTSREPGGRGRGYLATCTGFSERAFSRFVKEHRYKGPERFPEDSLHPGNT
jgi:hypothetical protein